MHSHNAISRTKYIDQNIFTAASKYLFASYHYHFQPKSKYLFAPYHYHIHTNSITAATASPHTGFAYTIGVAPISLRKLSALLFELCGHIL